MRTKIFNWLQCPATYGPSTLLPHLNKLAPVNWGAGTQLMIMRRRRKRRKRRRKRRGRIALSPGLQFYWPSGLLSPSVGARSLLSHGPHKSPSCLEYLFIFSWITSFITQYLIAPCHWSSCNLCQVLLLTLTSCIQGKDLCREPCGCWKPSCFAMDDGEGDRVARKEGIGQATH